MKCVIFSVFVWAGLALVSPACHQEIFNHPVKFCQDAVDKTWHPAGSSWRNSKCTDCDCSADSMKCCFMPYPTNYPDKCTVDVDYTKCTFEVYEKIPCEHSAVGK